MTEHKPLTKYLEWKDYDFITGNHIFKSKDVRSAVRGLYTAIGKIEKHESIQEDSNIGAFTAVLIREELRDWFPVFFEENVDGGAR